jgi:hypothetical protein
MEYYVVKIDHREYTVKDTVLGPEINTEIGWLKLDSFIDYLLANERTNALIDLAEIGLDRLVSKRKI